MNDNIKETLERLRRQVDLALQLQESPMTALTEEQWIFWEDRHGKGAFAVGDFIIKPR